MPQKRQVNICLRFKLIESLSGPVEVMVPLQMGVDDVAVPQVGVRLLCITLLLLLFMLLLLLLLFSIVAALRVIRLLALAQMRRFKSSLSRDFKGDTCKVGLESLIKKKRSLSRFCFTSSVFYFLFF